MEVSWNVTLLLIERSLLSTLQNIEPDVIILCEREREENERAREVHYCMFRHEISLCARVTETIVKS